MKQVSEATIERVRALMLDGADRSARAISEALHVSFSAACSAVCALNKRKQVYIVCFERVPSNLKPFAIYRAGNARNARKPKAINSNTGYQSREREWLKTSRESGSVVFRHPHDVWLFGECSAVKPAKLPRHIVKQDMTGESLETRRRAA